MPSTKTPTNPMNSANSLPLLIMFLFILTSTSTISLSTFDTSMMIEWTVLTVNSSSLSFPILLDTYSSLFMSTVLFISFNVMMFSKTYMLNQHNILRFLHIVSLFISSMIIFILSPNLMTMMLGWDGLGITSFLLVIFYQNPSSLKSGFITMFTNRIGDVLIIISIALLMSQGHWNMINTWSDSLSTMSHPTTLLIMTAAMTKSAQLPFSAWLPEAMAAPTPVSALVHSSTLVTAGVFLLIRFYPFLSSIKMFNITLLFVSSFTMVSAGLWACTTMDVKKMIALSTLSQLGLMLVALSTGHTLLCFLHLITHAMFKATLFITAGVAFQFQGHLQTIDNINLRLHAPLVGVTMIISLLALNAFFFTSGFYSKDMIFESILKSVDPSKNFIDLPPMLPSFLHSIPQPAPKEFLYYTLYLFMAQGALFTMMYTVRIWRGFIYSSILTIPYTHKMANMKTHLYECNINDTNTSYRYTMINMSLASLTMGSIATWMLTMTPDTEIVTSTIKIIPTYAAMNGMMVSFFYCREDTKHKTILSVFKQVYNDKHKLIRKPIHHSTLVNTYHLTKSISRTTAAFFSLMIHKLILQYIPKRLTSIMSLPQHHLYTFPQKYRGKTLWIWLPTSYHLATYILHLSDLITSTMDQGWYKLLIPNMSQLLPSKLSELILSYQAPSPTTLLLTIIMTMLSLSSLLI